MGRRGCQSLQPLHCGFRLSPCSNRRFAKRTVKMDKTHIADCKKLLTLMGMPV